jgi:hypothetical protein
LAGVGRLDRRFNPPEAPSSRGWWEGLISKGKDLGWEAQGGNGSAEDRAEAMGNGSDQEPECHASRQTIGMGQGSRAWHKGSTRTSRLQQVWDYDQIRTKLIKELQEGKGRGRGRQTRIIKIS